MKTPIKPPLVSLRDQFDTLMAFAARYGLEQRPRDSFRIERIDPDPDERRLNGQWVRRNSMPSVVFYGNPERSAPDRAWILRTFGATGWTATYSSEGWTHVEKTVNGVLLRWYQAVAGYLAEGIPVPASQLEHPANDPHAVAAAILEARNSN